MEENEKKAIEFDSIAETIFKPIYPVIAAKLFEIAGIGSKNGGTCIDIGCGGGHLGLAAANIFGGEVLLLDKNAKAIRLAEKRIPQTERNRIKPIIGDVHDIPLNNETVTIAISRGSMWFWDKERSLTEIMRILKPGGVAVIGGGFGSKKLEDEIVAKMSALDNCDWKKSRKKFVESLSPVDYAKILDVMGIKNRVINDESGEWLFFGKSVV